MQSVINYDILIFDSYFVQKYSKIETNSSIESSEGKVVSPSDFIASYVNLIAVLNAQLFFLFASSVQTFLSYIMTIKASNAK